MAIDQCLAKGRQVASFQKGAEWPSALSGYVQCEPTEVQNYTPEQYNIIHRSSSISKTLPRKWHPRN